MCQPSVGQMVFSNVSNKNVYGFNPPSLDTMYKKKKTKTQANKVRSPPLFWKNELLFTKENRENTKCIPYFSMRVLASPKIGFSCISQEHLAH